MMLSDYQNFIAKSRYARWMPEESRREHWVESVRRYINFFGERFPQLGGELYQDLENAIIGMEVMPSMRALWTAGEALDRDNAAGYNCSAIAVDDPRAFDEAMYLSMCGVGVGFSVERQYVQQLPTVAENFYPTETVIKVRDSKIGWASGTRQLISLLYGGLVPKWDLSGLRPAGAILKTFGGRSAGPDPLDRLFRFLVATFQGAAGRKLQSIECHDIMCMIGEIVVCGGVRRTAMISVSNLSDDRMRHAKSGQWWIQYDHRRLSNNSVAYTEKPGVEIYMQEMLALIQSKSGERGIYNRVAAQEQAKRIGRRDATVDFFPNPCSEINLRSCGFCNLSEVVVRPEDDYRSLKRKVKLATILGTLQSTLTDFRYLRKIWKKNAEEERLLGVSLTGIMDNELLSNRRGVPEVTLDGMLEALRDETIATNREVAEKIGINPSVAITCIKPSGTVSQLVDSSSGIHPRYGRYYLRAVQEDKKNPVGTFLKAAGVANEPYKSAPNDVDVFYFPMKSPDTSVLRNELTAVQQLELYLVYYEHWCEHNVSCTVYVREAEWPEVVAWVYKHFNKLGGVSFLPYTDHIYQQAPYTEITEDKYNELLAKLPKLDWEKLADYEKEDYTEGAREPACAGGVCEL